MNEKTSKVKLYRDTGLMEVTGHNDLSEEVGKLDFFPKHYGGLSKCPFILLSRLNTRFCITEKTARAFANYILKLCDKHSGGYR